MKACALLRNVVAYPALPTKISEAQPGEMIAGSTSISSSSFCGGIMILIATIFESLPQHGLCGKDFLSLASLRTTSRDQEDNDLPLMELGEVKWPS